MNMVVVTAYFTQEGLDPPVTSLADAKELEHFNINLDNGHTRPDKD